jgi:uncharacterized protein (TIGR00106 family)
MWIGQICTEDEEMLAEFSVVPIGKDESVSQYVAECMRIVEASGIAYKINPMGTVLEGDYDVVMTVVRKCHMRIMELCPRVMTTVRVDDRRGVQNALEKKIASVEEKVGKELKK